jgi:hypothetical protein
MLGRLELPPSLNKAVDEFRQVRNRIVHGGGATRTRYFEPLTRE